MKRVLHKIHPKNWFKPAQEETLTPQSNVKLFFLELLKLALFAIITIFLVRYFLFKPFYVRGASMEPSFSDKEYLIINEISYRFGQPQRGDIVVFRSPLNKKEFFLKRVIGLPGEKLKIKDGTVIIYNEANPAGIILKEDYLAQGVKTQPEVSLILGEDKYFVMGDNRLSSLDSRHLGPIGESLIIGKVLLRGWPLDRAQIFTGFDY